MHSYMYLISTLIHNAWLIHNIIFTAKQKRKQQILYSQVLFSEIALA